MISDNITALLDNSELFLIVEKYNKRSDDTSNESIKERYKTLFQSASAAEVYVPILGMQGTGKSTLLNALLMDDVVLPVDAQETNCVPTEIRKSPDGKLSIEILFHDNRPTIRTADPAELEQYVSNVYNKANEKGVKYAVVYHNHPLLDNQLVFVDLPGVGSTTHVNTAVTMDFIQKTAVAIFLFNSFRPLTRTELQFFKAVNDGRSSVWFVQNRWGDESDIECNETLSANTEIIKKELSVTPTIFAFDVKYAFETKKIESPDEKFNDFVKQLVEFRNNWRKRLADGAVDFLKALLIETRRIIAQRIEDLSKSAEKISEEIRIAELGYEQRKKNNSDHILEIRRECDRFLEGMAEQCDSLSNNVINEVEAQMQQLVQGGLVDGDRFDKTFNDAYIRSVKSKAYEINDELLNFRERIREMTNKIKLADNFSSPMYFATIKLSESFKFEKIIENTSGLAGAIAGGAAGGALFGPVGAAIGGIVGGILFAFGGQAAKEGILNKRRAESMRQVRKVLEESKPQLRDSFYSQSTAVVKIVKSSLTEIARYDEEEIAESMKRQRARLEELKGDQEEKRRGYDKERAVVDSALEVTNAEF